MVMYGLELIAVILLAIRLIHMGLRLDSLAEFLLMLTTPLLRIIRLTWKVEQPTLVAFLYGVIHMAVFIIVLL